MNQLDYQDTPEKCLARLGIQLPNAAPTPIGAFCNVRRSGSLLFVSGQGPVKADGSLHCGKVGADITPEEAREHARLTAINILATVRDYLGSLDPILGVVKLLGLVNATPELSCHPFIIDGASELLSAVFGAGGVHARSAFGVMSLPNQITVEIEAIFELKENA
jgi:enamine deaminase RidA (YjgF/YER057c/UK114 family)